MELGLSAEAEQKERDAHEISMVVGGKKWQDGYLDMLFGYWAI
jgi:hypothetical protein